MSTTVLLVVLLGALLHASWNALVRGAANRAYDMVLVVTGAAAITAACLPFAAAPEPASWPYLGASGVIHIGYFVLVALAYQHGQLSFAYPIMRGTAPALSAICAALILGESPPVGGWLGVTLICAGVLLLGLEAVRRKAFEGAAAAFALLNAFVIVVYTLVDGVGARLSNHPVSYTGWIFLLTTPALIAVFVVRDGAPILAYLRRHWLRGLVGGACTLGSYALALWAVTRAPIALVAALRETSVVFGVIIAATVLRERITPARYVSIAVVVAGAAAIKLA